MFLSYIYSRVSFLYSKIKPQHEWIIHIFQRDTKFIWIRYNTLFGYRLVRRKIQGKNSNISKPAGCWSEQNSHRQKTKKKTTHKPDWRNKTVKLEDVSTCYLAIKLEKFTECPARQIVKYKLNRKENFCSRKHPTDLTEEIK